MFWSEHDVERIARYSWQWDVDHRLTNRSWESVKDLYRERAEFVVFCLNNAAVVA